MIRSPPKFGKPPDTTQPSSPAAAEFQAALAGSIKMKDEFSYDFQLIGMDRASVVQKSGKVKVDYPGADYFSPIIRDTAAAMTAKIGRYEYATSEIRVLRPRPQLRSCCRDFPGSNSRRKERRSEAARKLRICRGERLSPFGM